MVKSPLAFAVLIMALLVTVPALAARKCVGSDPCSACTTCSGCKHCKNGGTCGTCAPSWREPAKRTSPTVSVPLTPPVRSIDRPAIPVRESPQSTATATENGVHVLFSPHGGCTAAIVQHIEKAKLSVRVLAYRLTSVPIVKAMREAHARGVKVQVVLDGSQQSEKYSDATNFHNEGMNVLIDHDHAIAHNKVMIIDAKTIITGSFNFSAAAEEKNSENLLIIEDHPKLAAAYLADFEKHQQHARPYIPPKR